MEENSCQCSDVVIYVMDRPSKRNAQETREANVSDREAVTIPTEGSEDGVLIDDKRLLDRKDEVQHSVKSTSSDNNGDEVAISANTTLQDPSSPPDGGWGWFVVLGSALIHILLGGFERSSGVLFLELRGRFGQSASATAWVSAIFSTSRFMMGPIASAICHRFTIRFVVFVGSLLFALGVLVTGYAPNLTVVYILFGLLGGFALLCAFYGFMLGAYISQKSIVIIDILGVEKLTSSFGLFLWFQGVGTLVGPPISGFLKDVFGIYDGAFYLGGAGMILGAFILLAGNVWKVCRDARSKDTAT